MKKLTRKQEEEIDWLSRNFDVPPSEEEMRDYIDMTVTGKKKSRGVQETNRLFVEKRKLDMTIKMWLHDWPDGILSKEELLSDDPHPYWQRVVTSLKPKMPLAQRVEELVRDDSMDKMKLA